MVDFETDLKACVQVLHDGGILLYPTDTIWGIGCNAMNREAVNRIYELKQRPATKSMIVLLADARDILQYVAAPPPDIVAMVEEMGRPTTVIYDNGLYFPDNVVNADGSIAIRVTNDPFCKALIKRFRGPIVATSANLSGGATPTLFTDIVPAIKEGVDYVVGFRQNDRTPALPSRLVRLNDEGEMVVLRD